MKYKLNRYDIIASIIIVVISLISIILLFVNQAKNSHKIAQIYYKSELVHTLDLNKKETQIYEFEATNGLVKIEAKEGKVRVIQENSPRNLCSIQGWSDSTLRPIVCLPNDLYIKIEDNQEKEVDVLI